MRKILARPSASAVRDVVILGSLSGRVDHGLGILHEMLRETEATPGIRLWLFSEASVSFILSKGLNVIHLPLSEGYFTANVGIIPIYGPGIITTKGLEWDVENWRTRMGFQVSTSNHIVADTVQVETSASVLFTVERAAQLQ
jgi:thiamine pyrophosphokinase